MSDITPHRVALVLSSKEKMGDPAGGIHKAVLAQIAALHAHNIKVHLLTASEPCADSAKKMGPKLIARPYVTTPSSRFFSPNTGSNSSACGYPAIGRSFVTRTQCANR